MSSRRSSGQGEHENALERTAYLNTAADSSTVTGRTASLPLVVTHVPDTYPYPGNVPIPADSDGNVTACSDKGKHPAGECRRSTAQDR